MLIDHAFSDDRAFRELYESVYDSLPEETIQRLKLSKSKAEWLKMGGTKSGRYDPAYSRNEVFADLYAHITGIGWRTEFSEILERSFGSECGEHIRNLVVDYIEKTKSSRGIQ